MAVDPITPPIKGVYHRPHCPNRNIHPICDLGESSTFITNMGFHLSVIEHKKTAWLYHYSKLSSFTLLVPRHFNPVHRSLQSHFRATMVNFILSSLRIQAGLRSFLRGFRTLQIDFFRFLCAFRQDDNLIFADFDETALYRKRVLWLPIFT